MRLIGDQPLTAAERQAKLRSKIGAAAEYARKRKWRLANPEKQKAIRRRGHLKIYSLTPEIYEAMWLAQDRRCASCKSSDSSAKNGWQVDHCHKTGRARGILCTHCNRMVGGALDDTERLQRGIVYLQAIEAINDST